MEAWRIARTGDRAKAFSGEGARLYGGRWNSPGVRMVYAAGSRSLAILEILVHLNKAGSLGSYFLYEIEIDATLVQNVANVPQGWNAEPPTAISQSIGDAWVRAASHPVLTVPSAVVPEERNYLLNPAHPGFTKLRLGNAQPYRLDPRLI